MMAGGGVGFVDVKTAKRGTHTQRESVTARTRFFLCFLFFRGGVGGAFGVVSVWVWVCRCWPVGRGVFGGGVRWWYRWYLGGVLNEALRRPDAVGGMAVPP